MQKAPNIDGFDAGTMQAMQMQGFDGGVQAAMRCRGSGGDGGAYCSDGDRVLWQQTENDRWRRNKVGVVRRRLGLRLTEVGGREEKKYGSVSNIEFVKYSCLQTNYQVS